MADNSNPWASGASSGAADSATSTGGAASSTGDAASSAAPNPWGTPDTTTGNGVSDTAGDWLANAAPAPEHHFSIIHPFRDAAFPVDIWVNNGLDWVVDNFRSFFQAVRWPIDAVLTGVQTGLQATPALIVIVIMALLAWQVAGRKLAIGTFLSLVAIGLIGAWSEAMITLALVITSVFFCVVIGLPTGIWLARNEKASRITRPVLDAMQTTPAFVYLVPIVMLFGIGNVPGVVVTIIFALPPLIRLTILGIRQVPDDLVEAARSFGASPKQLLFRVQLPLAMPTIMAGINQTLMLALSMVVIASMIAVGGLGQMVLRGIGRLDMGLATIGGIGIVLLAIVLDRMTQALGQDMRSKGSRHWYQTGPVGLVRSLTGKK